MRFAQHRRGYRSARLVKRHAVRLRPDLYEDLPEYPNSTQGAAAEVERARELARAGFVAHCDGTSHGARDGDWKEWDAERLEPVAGHVDAAVDELAAAAFEPLDALTCARLLHGQRGFWLQRYLDPGDPPPSYGLFPQVRLDVLEARAALTDRVVS